MISSATGIGAVGGAVCISAGAMAYAVRGRSSALFGPSLYHGVRDRPALALTFDDGPSESTPELLDILAKYGIRATFFQCGRNVRRLPDISRAVIAAGHEIGNHTDSHPYLHFKSSAFISRELTSAQQTIQEATGVTPRFFRAPYGVRWFGLREVQARLNLMGVMWTAIGVDWKLPTDRIVTRLSQRARFGAIFCLHDGRAVEARPDIRPTLEAVKELVPRWIDRGFHFEKVSEIICPTKN